MSYQARDSKNANSALIVTVIHRKISRMIGDLGGIAFQRDLEKYRLGKLGKGRIPVQLFGDFRENQDEYGLWRG